MLKKLNKRREGFTIIEVMIVLAIAGVIMLVVFLAVPALQRSSRNTQRKSDATHMSGLISEWQSNHGGVTLTKLNDSTNSAGPDLTNENFAIIAKPAANTVIGTYSAPGSPALDTFYIGTGATCNGSTSVNAGGGSRSFVVVYYVEPGITLQCVD